jgi:hypothetical protein
MTNQTNLLRNLYHLPQFWWPHFRAYLHRPVEKTREPIKNNSHREQQNP